MTFSVPLSYGKSFNYPNFAGIALVNHYEILGLQMTAGRAEVKTAFRRLAKQYHPDKNSDGKEHFSRILKAYEVLSDPVLRSSYDYKLNYHLGQVQRTVTATTASKTKTWSFDEKEMRRRQYYNEHFKKNNKTTAQYTAEVDKKKSYNEYKYIFFATPIAVVLFLLIMKLAVPAHPALGRQQASPAVSIPANEAEAPALKMGDMPYATFFGGAKYTATDAQTLTVKNETGREVIVCLFTKQHFIRSFYIRPDYFAEVSQLPQGPLFMRYSSGEHFLYAAEVKDVPVSGAFSKDQHFFKSRKAIIPDASGAISLPAPENNIFKEINAIAFFKQTQTPHDKKN